MGTLSALPALSIQQPQNPVENLSRIVALKSMLQNQQAGALQMQEQQLQIQSQKALQKAYLEAGGDVQKAAQLAVQYGADPKAAQSLLTADLEHRQKLATLDKDKLDSAVKTNDLIGQASQALLQVQDPQQRYKLFQSEIGPALVKAGLPQDQINNTQLDDATLQLHALAATKTNEQIDNIRLQKQQDLEAKKFAASQDPNNPVNKVTEAQLAQRAAAGDPDAEKALKRLDQSKRESKTVVNVNGGGFGRSDAAAIADAIESGEQPPTLQGLYRNAGPVRAELARRGVPLAKMEMDWKATQKYMATLNGPQQVRMQQAIRNASDGLDKIEGLYDEFQKIAPTSGFKVLNKASLTAMANMPGRPGAVASNLLAQINDLASEMGNVYMGGNSPTDHALQLGASNLKADWNDQTFKEGLKQVRANLQIRQNSIKNGAPMGVSGDNSYFNGGQSAPASGGGKILTSAQIAQAAKDHGVSIEEATRQAKAAGYEVK